MLLLPAVVGGKPIINRVHHTDALTFLKSLPDNFVDCCVTSPPYFGLRDYGVVGQIGLEPTPVAYVQTLVTLFRELRRVLKDSGTFWLNLGDSYTGSGKGRDADGSPNTKGLNTSNRGTMSGELYKSKSELPGKNLLLIPHRVVIALQDDGWIVRQDNVWHKPNPMPESVTDRTTRAHEYVFQLAKSSRYYYNKEAISEPVLEHSIKRQGRAVSDTHKNINGAPGQTPHSMFRSRPNKQDELGKRQYAGFNERYEGQSTPMANKRSVWTIPPAQFREAHFATFPLEIPEICIRAGCPPGGLVLDPFMGSGTTALVARAEGCQFIGSELNAEYIAIINKRLDTPFTPNMFLQEAAATERTA